MILSDIRTRALDRIEVDPTDPAWQFAATAAINEGQRIFAFLTLTLEATRPFILTPGNQFYSMLPVWPDWIVPLRVRISNNVAATAGATFDAPQGNTAMFNQQAYSALVATATPKLRPESLFEMEMADAGFLNIAGTPTRYGCIGADLLYLNRNPSLQGINLLIHYARMPVPLVLDNDVPEILDADHEALISYAIPRLRANEGGMELKNATPLSAEFLAYVKTRADDVRDRSNKAGLDNVPPEEKKKGKR